MRVGAWQFDVRRGDVEANLAEAERGLAAARDSNLDLVCLPEMWPTSFVDADPNSWLAATNEAVARIRALSDELGLAVCGSAFAADEDPSRPPRNRLHLFDAGEEKLSYDKVHLFSPTAENESFSAGQAPPATVAVRGARLSGVVCYDLRFGSLLRAPWLDEAELLIIPAQWPDTRAGHWRSLLIGRAVEHQAFVLGTNRTGTDRVGRRQLELGFPGNSLVVGPHGDVLAEGHGDAGLIAAQIDLEELRELRRRVPVRRDEQALQASPRNGS